MTTPRQIAGRFTAAYNDHDWARAAEHYLPDVVLVTVDAGELRGREHAAEYHRAFLQGFPDARVEVVASYDATGATIDEWTFHGTHTGPLLLPSGTSLAPTQRRISVRGLDVMVHRNGGIARHHVYFDQMQLRAQLGRTGEV